MNFNHLIEFINDTCSHARKTAIQQVNRNLTIRNWMIGRYIVEYEQNGVDRAIYGTRLVENIAMELKMKNIKGLDSRMLWLCRKFFIYYPQLVLTQNDKEIKSKSTASQILKSVISESETTPIRSANLELMHSSEALLMHLTFTHFIKLLNVQNIEQRSFYETMAINNNWSVRELQRAIATFVFERTLLSTNKSKPSIGNNDDLSHVSIIKDPYILDFLGLHEKPDYTESDLEQAIIGHLQNFLIELGRGFCFEARQKRISFDTRHYYIDLVFYHRILKCHILADLKVGEFDHADAGQMNMYLNYYRKNEMAEGDNPPIGIILCAGKNSALAEYATAGLPMEVFVSRYLIELPTADKLKEIVMRAREG